ncbi:hypothetical protein N7G274_003852 [Stereocaulon virgatum]|uniref:Fungal N-terminal domain-containing protein n=1 Tax=Stereocaulon virgatum TaxID=373712 RepID=A0ABR4AEK4_9LECA
MDPLSVSASIVGITVAAVQVSRLLKTFIDGANEASTSARGVLVEVTGIYVCLHQLEEFILGKREVARSRRSLIMIEHLIVIFTDCVSLFSELEQMLESLKTDGQMRVIDRLKWSRKESAISKLLTRLQASKASLNFMLSILTCTSMNWAEASTRNLSTLVQELLRSNVNMSRRLKALERMHPALAASGISRANSPTNEEDDSRTSSRQANCFDATFNHELAASPVYKRAALRDLRQSELPNTSNGPSSLSRMSLCDVSDLSTITLPISSIELWNYHRYTSSGHGLEASVASFDAWYNPPARKSAFIRTAYFNGQYTNQYAQSKFTGHLIYRRFTVTPNSTPIFKEGVIMPQSPKELERVSEEADEEIESAELEDTGIRDGNTSRSAESCTEPPPSVPKTTGSLPCVWPDVGCPVDTAEDDVIAEHLPTEVMSVSSNPSRPSPGNSSATQPPPDLPPSVRRLSSGHDPNTLVPRPRYKVQISACGILCEEEEAVVPTRKWAKPLSDMGDAMNWSLEILRTLNSIQY